MAEYEKITSLISKKEYEEATNEIFNLIRSAQDVSNKETIYKSLEYLNLICDKNPTVVSKILTEIEIFINDPDDWVRLITLEILYRISIYSPDDLIELNEKIKDRLWDSDPSVRSLGVKILGTIINTSHVDLSDDVSFIVQKLIDVDWKVKMIASNKVNKLIIEQPDKIKEVNQLIESASMNLRDENEDIREAAGKILKSLGLSILGRKEFFRVLFDLLEEDDWRVRETIIWILGEISHICSQEISQNLPRLIELLGDSHYIIQSKTIDMLVKIAEINFDMLMKMLINTLESDNIEIRNNIEEAIIYLGGENIQNVSYYIFENLDNSSPKIRNSITTILINLYAEVGDDFESEIFNLFNQFESKQWRQRKKLVNLLTEIALLLKNGKIYTWIGAELKNIYDSEDDVEVKEEIEINLERLKSEFPNLEMEIDKVQIEVEFLHNSISYFTNFPASFREKISTFIKNLQFDKAEMELNERVKDFLKELDDFDNKIRNYNIKPLVIDLLEEWEDIKVQILEEMSIIKEYEVEKLKSKKEKFRIDLKEKIKNIEDRIKILSVEFDLIKDFDHKLKSYISNRDALLSLENSELEEKFNQISSTRTKLFKFDSEIEQLILDNLEFKELFSNLLVLWTDVKLEIQRQLYNFNENLSSFKDLIFDLKMFQDKVTRDVRIYENEASVLNLNSLIATQLLEHQIQNITSQAMNKFKEYYANFDQFDIKVQLLIKNNNFETINNLLNITSERVHKFIEDIDYELNHLVYKNKNNEFETSFVNQFSPYLEKWNKSKEALINRFQEFKNFTEDLLFTSQINNYLEIMNPISLEILSNKFEIDKKTLKNKIFELIKENKVQGRIIDDKLYSYNRLTSIQEESTLLLFKNIKLMGNRIFLNFRITNPTNYALKDVIVRFKHPEYLSFIKENKSPKFFTVKEFLPGNQKKFSYVLRINRDNGQFNQNLTAHEIKLDIYYRDTFNNFKKLTRILDLLIS